MNIYCFSTLSFAKLQFKSVINKAFHKHGVASFTDAWIETETWALITMVVYAVVTHLHLVKRWNSLWLFNLASVIAFASVLMTFFGVNYFLSGMHSYGQNDNVHGIFTYLYIALGVVVVVAVLSYRRWKTKV